MDKIDRLGWAEGLSLDISGLRIGVRVNDPGHLPLVEQELLPEWQRSGDPEVHLLLSLFLGRPSRRKGVRSYDLLYVGTAQALRTTERAEVLGLLGATLRRYAVAATAGKVALSVGVATWRKRAILLPHEPGTGQSTLLKALVDQGARYYSDEWALVDSAGRVAAVPGPLRLDRPVPASELGYRPGRPAVPVGLVASLRYRAEGPTRMRVQPPGRTAMQLLAGSPTVARDPRLALDVLGRLAERVPTLVGTRGEAEEAARRLLKRLEG